MAVTVTPVRLDGIVVCPQVLSPHARRVPFAKSARLKSFPAATLVAVVMSLGTVALPLALLPQATIVPLLLRARL